MGAVQDLSAFSQVFQKMRQLLANSSHRAFGKDCNSDMNSCETLEDLQHRRLPKKSLCDELNFWNTIMGEHAEFIDGLLDPTEKALKKTARNFSEMFEKLVKECIKSAEKQIIRNSLETTEGIQDYKRAATIGLLECKIRSIIIPLLGDHVLREANHFLRILKLLKK
jgi:hypothetical protein